MNFDFYYGKLLSRPNKQTVVRQIINSITGEQYALKVWEYMAIVYRL